MSISVAMCTFNGAQYLKEQLDSIAAQTRLPHEIVICDDGSNDGTRKLVENFAKSVPFRVEFVVNSANLGSSRNFEKAIGLCKGELIALSDQDDRWRPKKLEDLEDRFNADPTLGGLFTNAGLIDHASRELGGSLWDSARLDERIPANPEKLARRLLQADLVTGATLMIRASARDVVLPIPSPWVHDGWIAWMLLLHSRIQGISTRLIDYRVHAGQQIGVATTGVLQKVSRAREKREQLVHVAEEFLVLKKHYVASPERRFPWLEAALQAKIEHYRCRSALPARRLERLRPILTQLSSYRKYSSLRGTLIRDLLWR